MNVDKINQSCLNKLPTPLIILASDNKAMQATDAINYPNEYINTLESSGLPPHLLTLKKDSVVMCLRNLNLEEGLTNGTRLLVNEIINRRLIKATILSGKKEGSVEFIPEIKMTPANERSFGFQFSRTQFPLKLAFAMTIHKSQGQSLKKVGVYLPNPVFSHGALYVAASRLGNPNDIKFFLPVNLNETYSTTNVVYHELLT